MRAIVRYERGAELVEIGAPTGEVVVEVAVAGVCRTDLAVADGTLAVPEGRVLGHEFSGHVDGSPVTVVPFSPCGTCNGCTNRAPACERWRWLGIDADGAFAEHVAVPARSVIALPRDMSLVHGAFVEPVAAALGVLPYIERGTRVKIGGTGRLAALTARVIAAIGGVHADDHCDVAIEHDGDLEALIPSLRKGGMLILKSRAPRDVRIPAGELVARELILRGVSHGSFHAAIDWLYSRRIVVDDLLALPRPLGEFGAVFASARKETQKQLFSIGPSATSGGYA